MFVSFSILVLSVHVQDHFEQKKLKKRKQEQRNQSTKDNSSEDSVSPSNDEPSPVLEPGRVYEVRNNSEQSSLDMHFHLYSLLGLQSLFHLQIFSLWLLAVGMN